MSNPYQTPAATVQDFADPGLDQPYEPRIFSTQGRIGRLRYFCYTFVVQMVTLALAGVAAAVLIPVLGGRNAAAGMIVPLMLLIYVPLVVATVIMGRRRLHDLDQSGWLLLVMLIPLANLVLGLYMMFWPGSKAANRFGPPPARNGVLVVLFGLVLPLAFIGLLAAVAIPAYQQYALRAQAASAQLPQAMPAQP